MIAQQEMELFLITLQTSLAPSTGADPVLIMLVEYQGRNIWTGGHRHSHKCPPIFEKYQL